MAGRIRTIKPEVTEDDLASALTDAAWRMWVSMWTLADDLGDVRASDKYLASHVWQDTTRIKSIPKLKKELSTKVVKRGQRPMIMLYEINGEEYARIKGFPRHQRMDNAGKPHVPPPTPEQIQAHENRFAANRGDSHFSPQFNLSPNGTKDLAAQTSDPDHLPTTPTTKTSGQAPTPTSPEEVVFDHWRSTLMPGAKRSPQRMRRIAARLKDGFTVEQLCLAITGATKDKWLMGEDPKSRPGGYRDIETVLRDTAQVERLIALADGTFRPSTRTAPRQQSLLIQDPAGGTKPMLEFDGCAD